MCKCTIKQGSCDCNTKTLFKVDDVCTLENGVQGWKVIDVTDKHIVLLREVGEAIVRKLDGTSYTTGGSKVIPPKRTRTLQGVVFFNPLLYPSTLCSMMLEDWNEWLHNSNLFHSPPQHVLVALEVPE